MSEGYPREPEPTNLHAYEPMTMRQLFTTLSHEGETNKTNTAGDFIAALKKTSKYPEILDEFALSLDTRFPDFYEDRRAIVDAVINQWDQIHILIMAYSWRRDQLIRMIKDLKLEELSSAASKLQRNPKGAFTPHQLKTIWLLRDKPLSHRCVNYLSSKGMKGLVTELVEVRGMKPCNPPIDSDDDEVELRELDQLTLQRYTELIAPEWLNVATYFSIIPNEILEKCPENSEAVVYAGVLMNMLKNSKLTRGQFESKVGRSKCGSPLAKLKRKFKSIEDDVVDHLENLFRKSSDPRRVEEQVASKLCWPLDLLKDCSSNSEFIKTLKLRGEYPSQLKKSLREMGFKKIQMNWDLLEKTVKEVEALPEAKELIPLELEKIMTENSLALLCKDLGRPAMKFPEFWSMVSKDQKTLISVEKKMQDRGFIGGAEWIDLFIKKSSFARSNKLVPLYALQPVMLQDFCKRFFAQVDPEYLRTLPHVPATQALDKIGRMIESDPSNYRVLKMISREPLFGLDL